MNFLSTLLSGLGPSQLCYFIGNWETLTSDSGATDILYVSNCIPIMFEISLPYDNNMYYYYVFVDKTGVRLIFYSSASGSGFSPGEGALYQFSYGDFPISLRHSYGNIYVTISKDESLYKVTAGCGYTTSKRFQANCIGIPI